MNANEFERVKGLFDRLADLPHAQRVQRIEHDAEIGEPTRRHLRALFDADVAVAGMTARSALSDGRAFPQQTRSWIGQRIGAFVIERELGRGGMGSVFLAHRADDSVEQKVAVKLIRAEQLDENTLARFRLERQVLALLKHPHIATLLDLGETDDGTPFVVMEYVEGRPISAYCAENKLDTQQRLRLFIEVCEAVSYAHRSMVVHRDLKPGNILVTADGQLKLLDFGIAKPLISRLGTQDVSQTNAEERFFSPANAAPEQLRGEPITVACDVYGLGVLLYELLANALPFDFAGKTPGEIERLILQVEPSAPSARCGVRALRGDLDAIVLHAMRKRPEERYRTVDQLADDVRRYLDGLPVAASRGRAWYRVRKFVVRHRVALGVAAVFFALLTTAAVMLLTQVRETIRQSLRARHATDFLVEAFRSADPRKALGENVTAKQILDQAQRSLQSELGNEPELRAELLARITEVKLHLSGPKDALGLARQALADYARIPHPDPDLHAELLELEARAAEYDSQYDVAAEALAQARDAGGRIQTRAALIEDQLELLYMQSKKAPLMPLVKPALDIAENLPPADPARWSLIFEIAKIHAVLAEPEAGIALLEKLLHDVDESDANPALLLGAKLRLAVMYTAGNRRTEAFKLMQSLQEPTRKLYGEKSVAYAAWYNDMGTAVLSEGDGQGAMKLFRESLAINLQVYGPRDASIAKAEFNMASAADDANLPEEAEKYYRECIDIAGTAFPQSNENIEMFRTQYGLFLNKRARFPESVALFKTVISRGDRNAEYQDNEVYHVALFGLAIAQYALAPTPKNLDEYVETTTLPADVSPDVTKWLADQAPVIASLKLPVPKPPDTGEVANPHE